LVAETWSIQELLQAGWSEADLAWEATAERTAEAVAREDHTKAKDSAGEALQLARANFASNDPRLGTSLANYGMCLSLSGRSEDSLFLLREGLDVWRQSPGWIAHMEAPRMARSSLFHMRMEARHRSTYRARWQERWREIAAEATARSEALIVSPGVPVAAAADAFARWRRERPAMLNDTRKLMAAAFLLLAPLASDKIAQ
jgi:aspartate/methionine/tyrosine aminotransferase